MSMTSSLCTMSMMMSVMSVNSNSNLDPSPCANQNHQGSLGQNTTNIITSFLLLRFCKADCMNTDVIIKQEKMVQYNNQCINAIMLSVIDIKNRCNFDV